MQRISKIGKILTKILEVFHWVGTGLMAAATVCALAAPGWVGNFVEFDASVCCGADLTVYGFEVNAPVVDGNVDMTTFFLFGIGASLILALMAMVFHHLHRIFRNSENATPFRKENIRSCRYIGLFSIAVPVIGFLMSVLIRLVNGAEAAEISVDTAGILMGVIVLCLTQFFVYGAQLEEDVDGLV